MKCWETVRRNMVKALISLGSNIDRRVNVPAAVHMMVKCDDIVVIAVSDFFETPAIDRHGLPSQQEGFLNAAVLIETALSADELRSVLRSIESRLGRVRTADKFAARPIDLDIAFYSDVVLNLEGSGIPDPDILRFPHVAVPLANVTPDWIHPQTGETLCQIAERLDATEMEKVIS